MRKFKIVYIEYNELRSFELEADDIITAIEDFRDETHLDRDSIISVKQIV